MANGRLAALSPAADTPVILYTCPSGTHAAVTVSAARRSVNKDEAIYVALLNSTDVNDLSVEDYLEYAEVELYEVTGIIVGPSQSIAVMADADTVSFVAYGYEELDQ